MFQGIEKRTEDEYRQIWVLDIAVEITIWVLDIVEGGTCVLQRRKFQGIMHRYVLIFQFHIFSTLKFQTVLIEAIFIVNVLSISTDFAGSVWTDSQSLIHYALFKI